MQCLRLNVAAPIALRRAADAKRSLRAFSRGNAIAAFSRAYTAAAAHERASGCALSAAHAHRLPRASLLQLSNAQKNRFYAKKASKKNKKKKETNNAKGKVGSNVLTMENISKFTPQGDAILDNISLSFFEGAKIGVVGVNGSGKSSLLRVLAGASDDDVEGTMKRATTSIGFLEQEPHLDEDETVLHSVAAGVARDLRLLAAFQSASGGGGGDSEQVSIFDVVNEIDIEEDDAEEEEDENWHEMSEDELRKEITRRRAWGLV